MLYLEKGAVIKGSDNIEDYPVDNGYVEQGTNGESNQLVVPISLGQRIKGVTWDKAYRLIRQCNMLIYGVYE